MEISGGTHNLLPFTNHSRVETQYLLARMNYKEGSDDLIHVEPPKSTEYIMAVNAELLPLTLLTNNPCADCRYVYLIQNQDTSGSTSMIYPEIKLQSETRYSLGLYVISLSDSISLKIHSESEESAVILDESIQIERSSFSYEDPEHINMVWNRVETSFVCDRDGKFSVSIGSASSMLLVACAKLEGGASCTSWSDHILATGVAFSQQSNYNKKPLSIGKSSTTPNRDGMYVSGENVPNIEGYIVHDSNLYRGDPTDGRYGAHLHVEGEFTSANTAFRIHGVDQFGEPRYRDTIGFMYDYNNITSDPVTAYVVKVRFGSETVEADPTEEYTKTTFYVEITPPDVQYTSSSRLRFSVDVPILLVNDREVSNPSYQPESNN